MNNSYKERTNIAFELHQNSKFDEAEKLYSELLKEQPNDVNVLNLYGMLFIAKSEYDKAIEILSRAFVLTSNHTVIMNLAKAYFFKQEYNNSIELLKKAIEINPTDDLYYSLALAYKMLSNTDEVINSYEKALSINPKNTNVLYNLALQYYDLKNNRKALKYALQAEKYSQNDEEILSLLASIYDDFKNLKQSLYYLKKLILINSANHLYHYNLAVLYSKIGNIDLAINAYKYTLKIKPDYKEAIVNLSNLYQDIDLNFAFQYAQIAYRLSKHELKIVLLNALILRKMYKHKASINLLNSVIEEYSNSAELFSELAVNYMDIFDYSKALEYYEKAIQLNPNDLRYQHGKAIALKYLGFNTESKNILEKIIKRDKSQIQSVVTLGMSYLSERNFQKGMQLYLQRSKDTNFSKLFKQKIWKKGISLENKKVLLYSDCGLGDTIMYSRFLKDLEKIASNVVLQTDSELVKILALSFPNISIISKSDVYNEYDVVMPLMSLQYALDLDFDNVSDTCYLNVLDEDLYNFRIDKIFNTKNKKVGIFYSGNKKILKNRSIKFDEISKLFDNDNCNFYSFQIDKHSDRHANLINLSDKIKDYYDTACLLKCMDLVITIDSSIVHMAGSLGVKTYLLLPFISEWRWFNDENSTIWYKSVKIIKQDKSNDWNSVINRINEELIK